MKKNEEKKYRWSRTYSYIIPSLFSIGYIIYLILIYRYKKHFPLIQESEEFETMLETLVTFMSIILSVFGFLIPSFLSGKGESKAITYFLKYADVKVFAAKLKNIVAIGLVDTFLSCILFLQDVMSVMVMNLIIVIWLWLLFFFMCSSYRFISLMINLLLAEKKDIVQKVANEVPQEQIEKLNETISKL